MYPVPYGLVIAANNKDEAFEMAKKIVTHTEIINVTEIDISNPTVIFYESGNY